ncbi:hypothetical protein [Enterococcus sp. DIV0756]|uniref:hypothetical protein n=1 Tax=Enterococcus sp. DIV0756 TaxID=2774636 RepID=UPI003F27F271
MKKFMEYLIIMGFVVFFIGGLILVCIQIVGLIGFNQALVVAARKYFSWIFPLTGLTGLLCWLYSYLKEGEEQKHEDLSN